MGIEKFKNKSDMYLYNFVKFSRELFFYTLTVLIIIYSDKGLYTNVITTILGLSFLGAVGMLIFKRNSTLFYISGVSVIILLILFVFMGLFVLPPMVSFVFYLGLISMSMLSNYLAKVLPIKPTEQVPNDTA